MSVTVQRSAVAAARKADEVRATGLSQRLLGAGILVPVALFAGALVVRAWAIGLIRFPMTEGSAYYVDVARNLATGRGLVVDAIWSYATPPLTLPRPAFELWQPLASILAAVPMALLGPTFDAARVASVVLGALLAPLAWYVAREAGLARGLPHGRVRWVALGAGVLVGIGGPFVFATAVPDSAMPFTFLVVAACTAVPRALAGSRGALVALGVLLGLAYLTRMEAIWVGAAFAALALVRSPSRRSAVRRIAAVVGVVALIAAPWWLRNLATFGSPFPGQISDNVFLARNVQIFGWADQPTLDGFLAQGLPTLAGNIAAAVWHNAVNVLLVPSAPVVAVAAVVLAAGVLRRGRRDGGHAATTTLTALMLAGTITFAITSILFPVATLWGTFEHAAGPLLVGLTVVALLGADAFVAWLVRRRGWQRANAWLAPLALVVLTVPLTLLHLAGAARQAADDADTMAVIGSVVPDYLDRAGIPADAPVITDRPVWVSAALGRPGLALPDEPVSSVLAIARHFGARSVVVVEPRGDYPAALDAAAAQPAAEPGAQPPACIRRLTNIRGAAVFAIAPECAR
jgi:4-amino-4-deoxy-L-arabinose transferase-like glycosyltransferase